MNAITKKLIISALTLGLSGAVYAQAGNGAGAGGEGAGGGGSAGTGMTQSTGKSGGAGMHGNGMGGSNDGSTGAGAPVRSGMGDGTNQGPTTGVPSSRMNANGANSNSGTMSKKGY